MKPQSIKKQVGAKRAKRLLPEQYLCIAPAEAPLVFDWLNGVGIEADTEVAEIHLRLCFHCQEAVARLMKLDEKFRANAKRCLHLSMSPSASDTKPESGANSSEKTGDTDPGRSAKVAGRG